MANQTPTEEKMHYESLMGLFKYALTFFSVIAIIVTFLIGNNLTEIKKTISEDVKESAKKLETVKTDADKTVADTKADAKQQLADMKLESQLLLNYTKDLTTMQINLLKEDARNLAISSARNKVEEAFKNNSVQFMIDQTARKEVNEKLKEVVKEETDKTRELFSYLPKLMGAYELIGNEQHSGLYYLDSLSNYAELESVRVLSKKLLTEKGELMKYKYGLLNFKKEEDRAKWLKLVFQVPENVTKSEEIKILVKELKSSEFSKIIFSYELLRQITGKDFKTFDSKPVYDWYNSNYKNN